MLVSAEKDEVEELDKMIKKLQHQIDEENRRLQEVEDKKRKDIEFVENAFYTSNEEGMGVSPNSYEGQNRMPRPGNRVRSPPREVPFGGNDSLEEDIAKIMPEQRIVKRAESPARFGASKASDTARSNDGRVGTGLAGSRKDGKKGKLQHGSLSKDDDKYEYYTSEDEFGRRIQKMRKKKKNRGGKSSREGRSRQANLNSSQNNFNETGRGRSLTQRTVDSNQVGPLNSQRGRGAG